MIELTDTTASRIAEQFVLSRTRAGSPAMGMVMTLIVVVSEDDADWAMEAARAASKEHPARVLGVILGSRRGKPRVNAQVGTGQTWAGETALIRLTGEVVDHPASVVAPLLLPDSPVVVWWPTDHPDDPAADPLGALASRRITDAAHVTRGKQKAMIGQCAAYQPGNTDLAWTRITSWRGVLATVLDQYDDTKVTRAEVHAERISPSADLMVGWLSRYLRVPVTRHNSDGPGITEVLLDTAAGECRVHRSDGVSAVFESPDLPDQQVALKRRELPELLTEELRHLDEDDVYAATVAHLLKLDDKKGKR